ncbi:MAG: hypothetical protein CL398_00810 [Acidiferrobacteraceae bacterium]|nr:hypothetical protein [Acidiferrobacteraceae bacterium]|tara:strand:- start:3069 stop:3683 length:615 start_codon:yes stop_codon:yes gene_type:complete
MILQIPKLIACVRALWFGTFVALAMIVCLYFTYIAKSLGDTELSAVEDLLEAGEYLPALTLLEDLRPIRPCDPHLIFMEARVYEVIGEIATAMRLYKALIELFPRIPESYNNLAQLHASQGNMIEAEKLLLKGLSTHSTYRALQQNLTTIYVARAANAYQQALNIKETEKIADLQPGIELIHTKQLHNSWESGPLLLETGCILP